LRRCTCSHRRYHVDSVLSGSIPFAKFRKSSYRYIDKMRISPRTRYLNIPQRRKVVWSQEHMLLFRIPTNLPFILFARASTMKASFGIGLHPAQALQLCNSGMTRSCYKLFCRLLQFLLANGSYILGLRIEEMKKFNEETGLCCRSPLSFDSLSIPCENDVTAWDRKQVELLSSAWSRPMEPLRR